MRKKATKPVSNPETETSEFNLRRQMLAVRDLLGTLTANSELSLEPVFDEILARGAQALHAPMAALHLLDDDAGVLALVGGFGLDPMRIKAWQRLKSEGETTHALCCRSGQTEDHCRDLPGGPARILCAPVMGRDTVVGCICFAWSKDCLQPGKPDQAIFAGAMGLLLGMAIEHSGLVAEMVDNLGNIMQLKAQEEERARQLDEVNKKLVEANEVLARLSTTDELTGISNRRQLLSRLEREVARWKRQGNPLCLIMADLDNFKRLNDTLGHQVGDEALKLFAKIINQRVREVDIVGRYGGEEFVIALADCELAHGRKVADQLRLAVEQESNREPFTQLDGFTVSMGIAQIQKGMSLTELISCADSALYLAKQKGRNRVMAPSDCDFAGEATCQSPTG